jgi:hypothetical protein
MWLCGCMETVTRECNANGWGRILTIVNTKCTFHYQAPFDPKDIYLKARGKPHRLRTICEFHKTSITPCNCGHTVFTSNVWRIHNYGGGKPIVICNNCVFCYDDTLYSSPT